jgi:BON domain
VRFLVRLILLPFRLLVGAMVVAFRLGWILATVPARVTARLGRLLGARGLVALVGGVALGLLLAPGPGRELRRRLRELTARDTPTTDSDLAERVVFELEHAPRTWHLPQPAVTVVAGRVALSGVVDEEAARDELGRVAAAVPGVFAVENLIVVASVAETGQN